MLSKRWVGRALVLGIVAVCGEPERAFAQLSGEFANTITVDNQYLTGANGATDIAFSSDGRAVVTLKAGTVVVRRTDGSRNMQTMLFGTVDTASEKGLLGVVAHPTEANVFFFYVSNGSSNDDKHRVYRGSLGADDMLTIDMSNPIVAASRMLGPGLRGPLNHDGGGLFVHENHLYIGVGDTGANMTPPTNKFSSCLNLANGKILRVNLDGTIPTDNPLVNETMVTSCTSTTGAWGTAAPDERIFAWGFRNPWRLWIDPQTDLMWIGDVGEQTREEISVGSGNQHYGYPFFEGTEDWSMGGGGLRLEKTCDEEFLPSRECVVPVHDYDSGGNGANCVIGGLIPEGCGWTNAFGGNLYYLFGDHGAGWIRALQVRPDRMGVMSSTPLDFGDFDAMSSFRMGPDGAMYVTFDTMGAVFRFAPTMQTGTDCMGGTGGMGGSGGGGAAGMPSGGSGGTGGASGGSGGRGMTGGASGANATGGAGVTGGAGGTAAGAGGAGGANGDGGSDDEGGCGCRTAGRAASPVALALLALGVAVGFWRRRKRG
jgi:MYXO-CTERM domain-containing protein